jgi:DNA-binding PadR family transcriptional regulator
MHGFFFGAPHRHCHSHGFTRHHRGFKGFGFGPGQMFRADSGLGVGGFGAGRKLGAADLQLLVLAMLAEKPRHGYEIIKALDERSKGYYSPSPGMVYPALTYLEEIGHATVQADGAKKLYEITKDGIAYLEANRAAVDTLVEQLAWIGDRMDRVRQAFTGESTADASQDFDAPGERMGRGRDFVSEIRRARRNLKSALISKFGSSADEQKRIAEILERAAKEIRGET